MQQPSTPSRGGSSSSTSSALTPPALATKSKSADDASNIVKPGPILWRSTSVTTDSTSPLSSPQPVSMPQGFFNSDSSSVQTPFSLARVASPVPSLASTGSNRTYVATATTTDMPPANHPTVTRTYSTTLQSRRRCPMNKKRPVDPARFASRTPETDLLDSAWQAWWCPETETPEAGTPVYESLIGQTPLIDISGLLPAESRPIVRVLAKVEYVSAGGSSEDRTARHYMDLAEARGVFKPDHQSVVTSECGDLGVSLAVMCAIRGFSCVAVVPHSLLHSPTAERLWALGARVITSADEKIAAADEARKLCELRPDLFFDFHGFVAAEKNNGAEFAPDAHYLTLGPEIWSQVNASVTHFVAHPSHQGAAAFLEEKSDGDVSTTYVVPGQSVFCELVSPERGLNMQECPKVAGDLKVERVTDREAVDAVHRLCREEGIMSGAKSGVNVAAALKLAAELTKIEEERNPVGPDAIVDDDEVPTLSSQFRDSMLLLPRQDSQRFGTKDDEDIPSYESTPIYTIVTLLPDCGVNFLSTLFNAEWLASKGLTNTLIAQDVEILGCLDLNCPGCSNGLVCTRPAPPTRPSPPRAAKAANRNEDRYANASRSIKRYEDLIGNTPLIDLTHLVDRSKCTFPDRVRVLAKVEYFNPGFSLKDRIARNIIDRAENQGYLKPGMVVVAASSGNTGASVAMLCAMRGYGCVITTDAKCSQEKADAIKAYGARLFVSKSGLSESDPDHYMNTARRLCKQNPGLMFDVDQYDTLCNPEGHYLTLGPEIIEQTSGDVTHFVCAGSTGGTVSGVGRYLKQQNSNITVVLADPMGSVFQSYWKSGDLAKPGKYLVEGVGKGSIPGAMDFNLVDGVVPVSDQEAFTMCERLCKEEGICAGGSSGLNVHAAIKLATTLSLRDSDAVVVTVMPDLGTKYLTKIYNPKWLVDNGLNPPEVCHVDGLALPGGLRGPRRPVKDGEKTASDHID